MDAACHQTNDMIADGEVVRSWRPDAGVKSAKTRTASCGWRWQESPVTGETTYKP